MATELLQKAADVVNEALRAGVAWDEIAKVAKAVETGTAIPEDTHWLLREFATRYEAYWTNRK